jgi:ATP-dependent Zn protease
LISNCNVAVQVREELSFAISQPIEHPQRFAAMGLSTATGVLLYGPPGALHQQFTGSWCHDCASRFHQGPSIAAFVLLYC